jgi:hypothetical protein
VQQDVIQRLAAPFRRVHENHQIFQNLLLSLEISELRRAYRTFKLLVGS